MLQGEEDRGLFFYLLCQTCTFLVLCIVILLHLVHVFLHVDEVSKPLSLVAISRKNRLYLNDLLLANLNFLCILTVGGCYYKP